MANNNKKIKNVFKVKIISVFPVNKLIVETNANLHIN